MADSLFRKKSLKKISSPEQLDDYVKVVGPGVWLILLSVIVLLSGIFVWTIGGHLDTIVKVGAICKDGSMTLYIAEEDIAQIREGMIIKVADTQCVLQDISEYPKKLTDQDDAYLMHLAGWKTGDWVYTANAKVNLPDGIMMADVLVKSEAPISFVVN